MSSFLRSLLERREAERRRRRAEDEEQINNICAAVAMLDEEAYSSASDEDDQNTSASSTSDEDEDDDQNPSSRLRHHNSSYRYRPPPNPAPNSPSLLPSALGAFVEIAGPPGFLNNAVWYVERKEEAQEVDLMRGRGQARRDEKELPAGGVVEAKAQLIGIRDRIRSDVEGSSPAPATTNISGEGKRVVSASNLEAKDAADLLRVYLQCGVPKAYSHARGMVLPICGDCPPTDPLKEPEKKKGSTIKDKEKNKRTKGHSSHATWKIETEMQLKQQFD